MYSLSNKQARKEFARPISMLLHMHQVTLNTILSQKCSSGWQYNVRFDRTEIWTLDFPLQMNVFFTVNINLQRKVKTKCGTKIIFFDITSKLQLVLRLNFGYRHFPSNLALPIMITQIQIMTNNCCKKKIQKVCLLYFLSSKRWGTQVDNITTINAVLPLFFEVTNLIKSSCSKVLIKLTNKRQLRINLS